MSSQAQDQSNKVNINDTRNYSLEFSTSSNVCMFLSLQIYHIKHNGAKFHMFNECFPNQFLHPSIRSITLSGTTQTTPNGLKQNSTTSTSSYLHLRRNIRLQDMKKSQHQFHFLVIKITMEPNIPTPLPPCGLTNKDSTKASQLVAFSYKTRKASLTG